MKHLPALSFFLSALISVAVAQESRLAKKYSSFIDTASAHKHLSILASDEFEGRETGKPGAAKAANYLSAEFKKLGLAAPVGGSYFQDVDLVEKSFEVTNFTINNTELKHYQDFYIKTISGQKKVDASNIVFVGYGISSPKYDDFQGLDIAGKVVMLIGEGEPVRKDISFITGTTELSEWSRTLNRRIDALKAKNPELILVVNSEVVSSVKPPKRRHGIPVTINRTSENNKDSSSPEVFITTETANLILKPTGKTISQLASSINQYGQPLSQDIKIVFSTSFGTKVNSLDAVNVLGYLEGTDLKDELIVISAHYDHIGLNPNGPDKVFNGADDDGSGTTAVLELAEAFTEGKKHGNGPRRSILFLLVVGEEKGLLGSEWYSENPVFKLENTITNLNIDMIGRVDPHHKNNPDYCYLIGSDKLSSELHKISENANATYTKFNIDYKYNDPKDPERIYYRSDHYNFAKHNIPVIFYFNGVHKDYHQPGDEVSKIDFPLLAKRAKLIFYTAWDLVNRDKRPVVDSHKE